MALTASSIFNFRYFISVRCGADADDGHSARKLGDALGQLFGVAVFAHLVLGREFFVLLLQLIDARFDIGLLAFAADNDRLVFRGNDLAAQSPAIPA